MDSFFEFLSKQRLNEFTDDGAAFQLAMGKNWVECWSESISIGGEKVIKVVGGYTSIADDTHTAVVNVMIVPKLNKQGADDQATETISIYFKDFRDPDDAKQDVLKFKHTIKIN